MATKIRKLASGKKSTDWVFFENKFEIPDYDDPTGEPSRIRWRIIHTPWFGIYLHKWNKPDPRPTLHNHPWNFFSIILWGNYQEIRKDNRITKNQGSYNRRWFNKVKRFDFHTVTEVKPGTISLMFIGKTHPDWGYMTEKGYVNFDKHPHSEEFVAAMKARKDGKK